LSIRFAGQSCRLVSTSAGHASGLTSSSLHRALDREGFARERSFTRYISHRDETTECIVGRVLDKDLGSAPSYALRG
jgi:hypothetical protein